ncbi:3-hydroxyacyl-CoA dehydrogenase family protein [Arthrobacter russicus]|jgi:3-hydroxybutyryl-CoA dehydrogenase|uniref:3-hydroxybutyryl-CoA dehydrogenase n=1 Tax=Arthrobacter russicus TaxID=172040 RepID=A0ABU1JCQ3_9MICC|nr:3-hydroxyacyl-CoA dehydrogenase family protein [Arthrobacter russicus]MDR6270213.1 3-hydroxybutyryl-CoA dehydrogenase [Arthrobacter russicus]
MSSLPSASGLPGNVGVIGGGRMGAGIAHAFLVNGCAVTVAEASAEFIAAARGRVEEAVLKSADRGMLAGPPERVLRNLSVVTSIEELSGSDLVVEAVPEIFELKVAALQRAEAALSAGAVLATNTSSLSVNGLAAVLGRPEQFLGMHFFNPVPASTMVELVRGERSPDALVATAKNWIEALGKQAIVVRDAPGFASSRLGVAIALEAMRMLEEGVASAADIDTAMELGYKHPMGPLRTTDVVGLDVRLGIAEYLAGTVGPRFEPPQILRDKVARGELGRKSGQGFFSW